MPDNSSVTQYGNNNNKITIVDPNPAGSRIIPSEDLFIYASLRIRPKGRSVLQTKSNGNIGIENEKDIIINFIGSQTDGDGREYMTTNWSSIGGTVNGGINTVNKETFGIKNISINYGANLLPTVNISFIDMKGASLFDGFEAKDVNGVLSNVSNYSVFFTYPYPIFELTIKGYYGKAVTYCLNMIKWSSSFSEGNFLIDAEFMGFSNSFLSDIIIDYVRDSMNTEEGLEELRKVYRKNNTNIELKTIDQLLSDIGNIEKFSKDNKFNYDPNNDDTGYDTLVQLNTALSRLTLIRNKIGTTLVGNTDDTTLNYYSMEGSYIKFDKLKPRYNIFAVRDFMMVDSTAIASYNEFVENLRQEIIDYDQSLPDSYDGKTFRQSYGIFSNASIQELLPSGTTKQGSYNGLNPAIDAIDQINTVLNFGGPSRPKDIGYVNSSEFTKPPVGFTAFTQSKGMGINNSVGIFDYYHLRNIVNKKYDDLSNERKKFADDVTKKINKKIDKQLKFNPSVGNIFEVLCNNVEAYLNLLFKKSIEAEQYNQNRVKCLKGKITDTSKDRVYPWPMLYDDQGKEKYLTEENKIFENQIYFPEIIFIEELCAAIVKKSVKNNVKEFVKLNGRNFPINPGDLAINNSEYNVENFDEGKKVGLVNTILTRLFLAYDYSHYQKQISDIAKFDAAWLHTSLINETDINAVNAFLSSGYNNFISSAFNTKYIESNNGKLTILRKSLYLNEDYKNITSTINDSETIFFMTDDTTQTVSRKFFDDLVGIQLSEKIKEVNGTNDYGKNFVGNLQDAKFNDNYYIIEQDFTKICWEDSVLNSNILDVDKLKPIIGKVKSIISQEEYYLNESPSYNYYSSIVSNELTLPQYLTEDEYKSMLILNTYPFKKIYDFVNNLKDISKMVNVPTSYLAWLGSILKRQELFRDLNSVDIFSKYLTNSGSGGSTNEFDSGQILNIDFNININIYAKKLDTNNISSYVDLIVPAPFNDLDNFNGVLKQTLISIFTDWVDSARKTGLIDFFGGTYSGETMDKIVSTLDFNNTVVNKNFVSFTPNFWNLSTKSYFSVDENVVRSYVQTFSQTFNDLTRKNVKKEKNGLIETVVKDKDLKLATYKTHKNLYDKWLGGTIDGKAFNSCGGFNTNTNRSLYSYFRFINKDYTDISQEAKINLNSLTILTNNTNVTFLDLISRIILENNFNFLTLPVFVDYSDLNEVKNIFRPFTNIEQVNGGPSFVAMYDNGNSKSLDLGGLSDYPSDGYDFLENDISSVANSLTNQKNNDKSLVVFRVAFGDENQSIFKNISISQQEFSETAESRRAFSDLVDKGGATQRSFKGNNLYNVYNLRSYTLNFELMGNAMVQPLMYLQLDNIPMFHGAYSVMNVSHEITPNKMTTKVKAVKKSKFSTPEVTDATTYIPVDLNKTLEFNVVQNTAKASNTNTQVVDTKTVDEFKSPLPIGQFTLGRTVNTNHNGIDLPTPVGTDVKASWSGTAYKFIQNKAGNTEGRAGYGLFVIMDHSNGSGKPFDDGYFYYTLYSHLSQININSGTKINHEQVFAKSGGKVGEKNSGNSTGPHLHYEIRRSKTKPGTGESGVFNSFFNIKGNDGVMDPLLFLRKKEYSQLENEEPQDIDLHAQINKKDGKIDKVA